MAHKISWTLWPFWPMHVYQIWPGSAAFCRSYSRKINFSDPQGDFNSTRLSANEDSVLHSSRRQCNQPAVSSSTFRSVIWQHKKCDLTSRRNVNCNVTVGWLAPLQVTSSNFWRVACMWLHNEQRCCYNYEFLFANLLWLWLYFVPFPR